MTTAMKTMEFVDCNRLAPGTLLDVETKNRHYQIECVGRGHVLVSGHPVLCPTPVDWELEGSVDKSGELEPGLISRDRYLKFLTDDRQPVTTSRVLHVRVQSPPLRY